MTLAVLLGSIHVVLFVGSASVTGGRPELPARSGPVPDMVALRERVDAYGVDAFSQRFEPALAPGLHAALGPTAPFYGSLAAFVIFAGLLRSWRSLPLTTLGAVFAVALALALYATGAAVTGRPAPIETADVPVTQDWRFAWQTRGSYPSRHALVAAALAVSALIAWPPLGIAGGGLALAGSAAAMYFGAAHVSDVAIGLVLGAGAAAAGRLGASLAVSSRLK